MEKMKKFKEWLKKHRKKIVVSILLIIYLFLCTVKLFALPHITYGNPIRTIMGYNIKIGDAYLGDVDYFNSTSYFSNVSLNSDFSVESSSNNDGTIIVNSDERYSNITLDFDGGLITYGDINNLATLNFGEGSSYLADIRGVIILPNEDSVGIDVLYTEPISFSTTTNSDWRTHLKEYISNAFVPSSNRYSLTDDTPIYVYSLSVVFRNIVSYGRIFDVSDMTYDNFVADDNARIQANSGDFKSIGFKFHSEIVSSIVTNLDVNVSDFYWSNARFSATNFMVGLSTLYVYLYEPTDNMLNTINGIYSDGSGRSAYIYQERPVGVTQDSFLNGFGNVVFFGQNATAESEILDLMTSANGEFGYFMGNVDGFSTFYIESPIVSRNINQVSSVRTALSKFGGYVNNTTTFATSIQTFMKESIGGFLDLNIFGIESMTFGNILAFIIGLAVISWALKVFLGG